MIYRINSASACRRRMKGTTPLAERGAKAPSPPASRCVLLHCPFSAVSAGAKRHKECFSSQRTHSVVIPCCLANSVLHCLTWRRRISKPLEKRGGGFVHSKTDRKSVYVRTYTQSTYFHRCCGLFCRFSILAGSTESSSSAERFYSLFSRFALVYGSRRNPILIAYPWTDLLLFWI